ncbi:MAG TPA: NADPH-dependent FMN reductase [Flavitalea sp.]|nr:NADPH-dependent FMN reductase [Flavitalea sp.]
MSKTILIVPGSIRKNSTSHQLIPAVTKYFPAEFTYEVFDQLGELPHFNDAAEPGEKIVAWRKTIAYSAAVIFITPEYAYGVPGTLKNALDWIVSSGELVNKPTALITASTGGQYAHESLIRTLGALTAEPDEHARLLISFIRSKLDTEGHVIDQALETKISDLVTSLTNTISSTTVD